MAAVINYSKTSPYSTTQKHGFYLDVANVPTLPYDPSDVQYQIDVIYKHRPDLLAYDLYGDTALWWVFAVRNPDVINDPIFDCTAGTIIKIPPLSTLSSDFGI